LKKIPVASCILWASLFAFALFPVVEVLRHDTAGVASSLMMPLLMGFAMVIAMFRGAMNNPQKNMVMIRDSTGAKSVVLLLIGVTITLCITAYVGFVVASLWLLFLGLFALGERSWWYYLAAITGWLFTLEVVFKLLLRVPLPEGMYQLW